MTGVNELATQALTWLLDIINKWLDVAPQYVVDLIHRYWMFYGFANLFWVIISWIIFGILIHYWLKWCKECEEYWPGCIGFALIPLVPLIMCIIHALKAFMVPEIVMIDALQCTHCH